MILVTGATGNVGRNLVSQLLSAGARVRGLARNPAVGGLPDGLEMMRGDLSNPSSLKGCLEGVDTVFLIWRSFTPAEIPALMDLFSKHARRIVFLSAFAVRDDLKVQLEPIGKICAAIEGAIKQTGLEWTIVRSGPLAANVVSWWGPQIRAGDVLRWPCGAAAYPPIHERDVATVAVRTLTEKGHAGKTYLITGGELLTHIEQLHTIGEVIGRPLRFEELPPNAARQRLGAFMPPGVVDHLLEVWSRMVTEPLPATGTVAELTGAPPLTYREWATDHARDFRSASESPKSAPVLTPSPGR
jgi:uncharacterized protein YbjT (DUF2867 family)